jgi:hypothetical protein
MLRNRCATPIAASISPTTGPEELMFSDFLLSLRNKPRDINWALLR